MAPEDASPPSVPGRECALYLRAFNEVSETRQAGFNGPQPLQLVEVAAWCRLNGIRSHAMRSAVVRIVRALDRVFMEHAVKLASAKEP